MIEVFMDNHDTITIFKTNMDSHSQALEMPTVQNTTYTMDARRK